MALEGKHIRFAIDVKDKYKVEDIEKYVSGSIYPDSRYKTGIDRTKMHLRLDELVLDSDFKKGWHAHLWYDHLQLEVHKQLFPEIFIDHTGSFSEVIWIKVTALKILQDMMDIKEFDVAKYATYLDYAETYFGEDVLQLKEYNRLHKELYLDPLSVGIEKYEVIWRAFNLSDELIAHFKKQIMEFQNDPRVMELISAIYDKTLEAAKKNTIS